MGRVRASGVDRNSFQTVPPRCGRTSRENAVRQSSRGTSNSNWLGCNNGNGNDDDDDDDDDDETKTPNVPPHASDGRTVRTVSPRADGTAYRSKNDSIRDDVDTRGWVVVVVVESFGDKQKQLPETNRIRTVWFTTDNRRFEDSDNRNIILGGR
jgi:hypothetical protein